MQARVSSRGRAREAPLAAAGLFDRYRGISRAVVCRIVGRRLKPGVRAGVELAMPETRKS